MKLPISNLILLIMKDGQLIGVIKVHCLLILEYVEILELVNIFNIFLQISEHYICIYIYI